MMPFKLPPQPIDFPRGKYSGRRLGDQPKDEAEHLTRVLRLGPGELVHVFDGRGGEFLARVEATSPAVSLAIVEPASAAAEPPVRFTLVQAVLKGASMDDVVRDATMMGIAAVMPVLTAHVAVKLAVASRQDNVERWRRVAVASAKQSRRAVVPDIDQPIPLAAALKHLAGQQTLMFVEPEAGRAARPLRDVLSGTRPAGAALLIGPEGGWAPEELNAAVADGATLVTLGTLTLRAESVALAALAACRVAWE